ncbi:hypothetical protein RJ639_030988 [Escallonia herrerae]|uniref:non-specific serine/threonine protein kinase n=1 Tax=Escallonia herrerae TaxID=1293975 RepID=A0AA88WZ52_9ASTE|nr:hypothetical protein RJ639_030988 [Escallonia herrerae]
MNPSLFFLIFAILIHVPTYLSADDAQYVTCGELLQCANVPNIGYPFWGGSRPESCGYPGFQLTNCQGDAPIITVEGQQFRVLAMDNETQRLTVARQDMWNETCAALTSSSATVAEMEAALAAGFELQWAANNTRCTQCSESGGRCGYNTTTLSFACYCSDQPYALTCNSIAGVRPCEESSLRNRFLNKVDLAALLDLKLASFDVSESRRYQPSSRIHSPQPGQRGLCRLSHTQTVGSQPKPATGYLTIQRSSTLLNPYYRLPTRHLTSTTTRKMPRSPSAAAALLLLLLTIFAGHLPTSSSQDTTAFSNCNATFSCGPIQNITYPFTGGARPSYCGLPDFHLTCNGENYPELTANSLTYRILRIDQTQQSLSLVRLDLFNTTCPGEFHNSTFNSTIFSYGREDQELNLVYGCNSSAMRYRPHNLFSCNVAGSNFSDAFYLVGAVPSDPILNLVQCRVILNLLVLRTTADRINSNQTSLGDALTEGFSLNYSDPYRGRCSDCVLFGGQCGFDSNSSKPICICQGDRLCDPPPGIRSFCFQWGLLTVEVLNLGKMKQFETDCDTRVSCRRSLNYRIALTSGGSSKALPIALPVTGAILAGIGIGWVIFACLQKRKRRAAQGAEAVSKDLPTPPSSKGLSSTPSTKFTRSIPSYPNSKSDFGKASTYFGVQVFSYTELEEATDNFDSSKELGDGGFGTVYYGTLQDGRVVAVKRLYENNFKRVEQFINEVEILTRLDHQYLVKLYGCTSKRSRELLLVYEYIPNGTVADHLHGKRASSGLLSWPVRLKIAIETADALAYLHTSDIIHRDVKTNNILLDNDFCVKVADFGLSRLFPNDATHVSTAPQGTPGYVDPEYYQCYQLTDKSDVYSFGVVLVELISSLQAVDTNRHRHDINLANMAISKIQNHMLHELVDSSLGFETDSSVRRMTTLVAELAFRCLQQEKDMRPSMQEVLDTLRGIQNEELNGQKAEVVDIVVDDGPLLKGDPSPPSPDSVVMGKWLSTSTPNSSG